MIKFKNGSEIVTLNSAAPSIDINNKNKSANQMKWILGDLYKTLHWWQKLNLTWMWNKHK
jgi:hypothetical protein